MTSDAGFRDYATETLDRLQQRGIVVNPRFASALEQFIIDGFNRSIREGASRERFEAAWEQLIEATHLPAASSTCQDRTVSARRS